MNNASLYVKKNTGFLLKRDDTLTPTFIYQPTPEGVAELCAHYSQKYSIDLRCIDLREQVESGDNIYKFFDYLRRTPSLLETTEGQMTGFILSHGQHHVVPLLIAKIEGISYMVSFDSTSGSRIKGYFGIADLFPSTQFYLNKGTRQADEGSCMTDAICVLKEALLIPDIIDLIRSKPVTHDPAFEPGRFFSKPKPEHFHLFTMPEELLLTAQRSRYLNEANTNVILRGGRSLQEYRDNFLLPVILLNVPMDSSERPVTPINGYLYLKAAEHKGILDAKCNRLDSLDELDLTATTEATDPSPYIFPTKGNFSPK